jgi:TRAP-type C4-dicarboxylate transport system substrate-binding protein
MDTDTTGWIDPDTEAEAREAYEALEPAARTVVRETAKAMEFDQSEYETRVTSEVVETVRDALFASLLAVTVDSREAFEDWRADYEGEVIEIGSETVDGVVRHAPGFADEAVVATFQDEADAAVATLRRQAFGRLYREVVR